MKRYLAAWLFAATCCTPVSADDLARGKAKFQAGKYRSAYTLLKPFAEQGEPLAQLYIGQMYASGRLPNMDGSEAARWFRKAAEQGNAEAQYSMGRMYLSGWGVIKNHKLALEWLWKSGSQGFLKSQLLLGKLLSEGKQVPQDLDAARLWYAQAANKGSKDARQHLDALGGADLLSDGGKGLALPVLAATAASGSPQDLIKQRASEPRAVRSKQTGASPVGVETPVTASAEDGDDGGAMILGSDDEVDTPEEESTEGVEEFVLEEFDSDPGVGGDTGEEPFEGDEFVLLDEQAPLDETDVDASHAMEVPAEPATAAPATLQPTTDKVPAATAAAVEVAAVDESPSGADAQQASGAAALYGRQWVMARVPSHYTIQLIGSWSKAEAEDFVAKNPLPGPGAIVETRRRGKPWFSVFYGDFGKYSQALAAHGKLSGGLAKHGPWIRPYKKIQASLGGAQ